jgi:hypothetical protein
MSPCRSRCMGPYLVNEYYWAGEMAVYVNHLLCVESTFDEVVERMIAVYNCETRDL